MSKAHDYCKNVVAKSGTSFYYSFLFLPPEKRKSIIALYAFCREIDDIADECSDKHVAKIKLQWWQQEIERIYHGNPLHPVGIALSDTINKHNLEKQVFFDLLSGMYMDLQKHSYATFAELKQYCYKVASTVGILSTNIFGFNEPETIEYAKTLGVAFQLVNIIRDLGEDVTRGIVYLPQEELIKFSISPEELLSKNIANKSSFNKLMLFQADRARKIYKKALALLPKEDRYAQLSGIIMAEIYFNTLDLIEKNNFSVLKQRISISPLKKMFIAWNTYRGEKKLHKQHQSSVETA